MEASVYSQNSWLKSGKAVIGLVVSCVLSWSNAVWQSSLQWKTASFLVSACKGGDYGSKTLDIAPVVTGLNREKSGLPWLFSGVGWSLIAARSEGSGSRPSSVTLWPR